MPARVGEARFFELVREALEELPPLFRRYLSGLEVRVEDYPADELMLEWGLRPPNYPFGMYEGPTLIEAQSRDFPGTIVLFRRPLEERCQDEDELRDQIRRTVFHELAHRFGFPEEGMVEELRAGAGLVQGGKEEARRHLVQAEHDLGAAKALLEKGVFDWALEVALASVWRALFAFVVERGADPAVVREDGIPELLARAATYEPGLSQLRELGRLERITVEMGDPGVPPPKDRVPKRAAMAAVRAAEEILRIAKGGGNGEV